MVHLHFNSSGVGLRVPYTIVDITFRYHSKKNDIDSNDFVIWLITQKRPGVLVTKISNYRYQVIFPYETPARDFYNCMKQDLITRKLRLRPDNKNYTHCSLFGRRISLNLALAKLEGVNLEPIARIHLHNNSLNELEVPYCELEKSTD